MLGHNAVKCIIFVVIGYMNGPELFCPGEEHYLVEYTHRHEATDHAIATDIMTSKMAWI